MGGSPPGAPVKGAPSGDPWAARCRSRLTAAGAGIIGAGLAILGFAFYTLNILLFVVALLAVGFVALEYLTFTWTTRGFSPSWFAARREGVLPRVDVMGTGSVGVTLLHRGPRGFYADVFDAHPSAFDLLGGSPRLRTYFDAGSALTLFYLFRAERRGLYTVGPTTVVAHDGLGLAFRMIDLDTRTNLYVTPASNTSLLGATLARLRTRFLGAQALRRRGFGSEFRSLREYLPTDDYRTIAWRRSGKGRLFVREFEQENRQDFLVLLDASSAMALGEPGSTALDRAVEATQVLASYVAKREDTMALLAWAQGPVVEVPAGRGPDHLVAISRGLAAVQPVASAFDGPAALARLAGTLKSRTHVFLFCSLSETSEAFRQAYAAFSARGHRLYVFAPSVPAFYPTPDSDLERRAFALAQGTDAARAQSAAQGVRGLGVPLVPYEREGAVAPLVALYSSLRAWGFAR